MKNKNIEKKSFMQKVIDDLVTSTKTQHQISKAQHELNKVSPAEASHLFRESHAQAIKPHNQKQMEQLDLLQSQIATKKAKLVS